MGAAAELVVAQRGEQVRFGAPSRELDRCDAPTPGGDREERASVDDLAGTRHVIHAQELDPFDVADDRDAHARW